MSPDAIALLRESARWRLLGLLFECPTAKWREEIKSLSAEVSDPDLAEVASAALDEAREPHYHTTFGPGGPAQPREVSYRGSVLAGQVFSDLSAYYHAFAYEPVTDEPPDHIAVKTGFVAYLKMKQAYAVSEGMTDEILVTSDAAERFIADHIREMAQALTDSLSGSGIRYLARAAALLHCLAAPVPTCGE